MRRSLFGSHLYNQIVVPLLLASVLVGVVATVVAVFFLQRLTDQWVAQVAEATTSNVTTNYREYAAEMERVARVAGSNRSMQDALASGDAEQVRAIMVSENLVLGYDAMALYRGDGTPINAAGVGRVAFRAVESRAASSATPPLRTALVKLGDKWAIASYVPLASTGREPDVFAVAQIIDDEFLSQITGDSNDAFCFYGPDGESVAHTIGEGVDQKSATQLIRAVTETRPEIREAVAKASGVTPGTSTMRLGTTDYQVWAHAVELPEAQGGEVGYVVGLVSQRVTDEAARTTTNLIFMWSIVAVVALVGLGGWVARRVSDPLVELADGARRISEGDFTTKVHIEGNNEVAELATSFNNMTDSLKERSESLTKKVLELATLYEMSRALGSTLDMDELLGSVLDSGLRIFDLDLGYITLRDRETGLADIRAVRGGHSDAASGAVRSSMSEWVVREGRPLIFNPDSGLGEGQIDAITGARAALCVPLVSSEGTIGSITIGSSDQGYRFNSDDVRLLSTIANHVTIAIGNIELFSSLQEAYLATVRSLAAAVDAKDTYTRGHSDRVATYATLIAEEMGLSHEQRIALEMAAYLHDIGKIGIAEEILLKPGRLDDEEMTQMRHHPLIGANILKPVAFPWAITPVVRHHHEHFDGSGYPAGLRGEEIPLLARILTVADSYEAMTADRPYRKGRDVEAAVEELKRCAGTQFDPRVVATFIGALERVGDEAMPVTHDAAEDISSEEARAIFASLIDGVFSSFRRLGGPRLSSNVEARVDTFLEAEKMPFRIVRGKTQFTEDPPALLDGEVEQMRAALRRVDEEIGQVSGSTLVEHFYTDAFGSFSGRMRHVARVLGFHVES